MWSCDQNLETPKFGFSMREDITLVLQKTLFMRGGFGLNSMIWDKHKVKP